VSDLFQPRKAPVLLAVPRLNRWIGLCVALALVAAATILRIAIGPILTGAQFITFFPAVILATYLSGLTAGLLAVASSTLAAWYFIVPSALSLALTDPGEEHALAAFVAVAMIDVLILSVLRSALIRGSDLNAMMLTTFDAHPDGVLIVDAGGMIVDCNRRAQAMFGLPRSTLVNAPLDVLLPAGARAHHQRRFAAYQADPSPREMGSGLPLAARRSDGSEFPVDVQIGPLRLRQRTLFMATVRDITEQREAALALAESHRQQAALEERARNAEALRRWADAFENAAFGISIWDARTSTIQFANPAAAAMSGLTVPQVQGRPILDDYEPTEQSRVAVLIETADRTGHVMFEAARRRADGHSFPVQMHITSVPGPDGPVLYRIVTAQDITQRRLAEAMADEFHAMDKRFRQIFDESPIGMALATAEDYRMVRVNAAFATMLGRLPHDLIGCTRYDVAHPDDRDPPEAQELGSSTAWHPTDKRFIHADGHTVQARVRLVRLGRDATGQDLVLGVAEDVTRQRQIEQALHQSQRMDAIGHLAGGMAHDFNNMLAVVIGSLDSVETVPGVPHGASELVGDALSAALRGADLTRSLLAFARRQPLSPTELRLNDLIRDMSGLLIRLLREDVTVSLDLAPDLWPVTADRAQLEAALMNLASNARDAMPNGGRLCIATANRPLDADYCNLHPGLRPGDYTMIEVADTGSGMPPDVAARIFDPFFTTKSADRGTGLGLSILFGFVRQSGGHIDVYSEPSVGTAFHLYLPRALSAANAETTAPKAVTDPRGDGTTVLVVEDNQALRRIVARQLRELGYGVLEADNGAQALTVLDEMPVDLMFSDVVMPGGMNGFELTEQARARHADLRIVLTSGYPQRSGAAQDRRQDRTIRLLQKPYRKQELAQALRAAMDC
jgi:PAS domain S-box-containing protein